MGKSRALAETDLKDGLPDGVKKAIIAPGTKHSLKGMPQYADAGCYIIYHPEFEGVTVHRQEDINITYNKPSVESGWRD